jgi:hypothetical protein
MGSFAAGYSFVRPQPEVRRTQPLAHLLLAQRAPRARTSSLDASPQALAYSGSNSSSCDAISVSMQLGQMPWLNRVVVCCAK